MAESTPASASSPAGPASAWPTRLALLTALLAVASAALSLSPWTWPAWPAASLGVVAIAASTRPGPALARAAAAFLGLVALIVAVAQIVALYGAAALLDG